MQQFNGRPDVRDRREFDHRRQVSSNLEQTSGRDRKLGGEPAKYNSRSEQRRISWENDLYERQSI
jgi:hypothetical protein